MSNYVCVIGHGASAESAALGPTIDGAQAVIRMHDWHWQASSPRDYGVRCDYMCLPGPWFEKACREMLTRPSCGYLCYVLKDQRRHKRYPEKKFDLKVEIYDRPIAEAFAGISPFVPTRGAAALVMAAVRFPSATVVAVGFDSLFAGRQLEYAAACPAGKSGDYAALIGQRANSRHDFAAERAALFSFFRRHERELICGKEKAKAA